MPECKKAGKPEPTVLGNAGSNTVNGLEDDLYLAPDGKLFVSQNHTSATGVPAHSCRVLRRYDRVSAAMRRSGRPPGWIRKKYRHTVVARAWSSSA